MAFQIPTREGLASSFLSDYSGAFPGKNTAKGSDPWRLSRVISAIVWAIIARLLFFLKIMLPDTAEAEWLERWGAVYDFKRRQASGATGTLALRVTGTVGAAVPVNTALEHEDGTQYKVTTVGAVIGGSGYVDVSVAATSTGLATNKRIDDVLSFPVPPTNVDAEATLVVDLENGLDIESIEEYRVRFLAHLADPPEGGAWHDYIEWAKKIPGVKDAYVWSHRRGLGTIDLVVLGYGSGADRIVTTEVNDAVDAYIETVRPGNVKDWKRLTPTAETQDIEATIEIDGDRFKWDWDDAGVGYAISAHNEGAQTITVPTAPAAVKAGVRITVLGEEALVTNRTGNVLTLAFGDDYDGNPVSWFTFVVSTQDIRASGDLVRPARDAIQKLFNTLGPARSGFSRTSWTAELKRAKLFAAITDVDGIDDCTLTSPASSVDPVDDYNLSDTIKFLVPGNIKIWKAS